MTVLEQRPFAATPVAFPIVIGNQKSDSFGLLKKFPGRNVHVLFSGMSYDPGQRNTAFFQFHIEGELPPEVNIGEIVGAVVGGIVGLAIVVSLWILLVVFIRRKQQRTRNSVALLVSDTISMKNVEIKNVIGSGHFSTFIPVSD